MVLNILLIAFLILTKLVDVTANNLLGNLTMLAVDVLVIDLNKPINFTIAVVFVDVTLNVLNKLNSLLIIAVLVDTTLKYL